MIHVDDPATQSSATLGYRALSLVMACLEQPDNATPLGTKLSLFDLVVQSIEDFQACPSLRQIVVERLPQIDLKVCSRLRLEPAAAHPAVPLTACWMPTDPSSSADIKAVCQRT